MSEAATNACVDFVDVCAVDEFWDGEMEIVDVRGKHVLLVKHEGQFFAFQSLCPHQAIPLIEGKFEDGILTCRAHHWEFDVKTGRGSTPLIAGLDDFPCAWSTTSSRSVSGRSSIEDKSILTGDWTNAAGHVRKQYRSDRRPG